MENTLPSNIIMVDLFFQKILGRLITSGVTVEPELLIQFMFA